MLEGKKRRKEKKRFVCRGGARSVYVYARMPACVRCVARVYVSVCALACSTSNRDDRGWEEEGTERVVDRRWQQFEGERERERTISNLSRQFESNRGEIYHFSSPLDASNKQTIWLRSANRRFALCS